MQSKIVEALHINQPSQSLNSSAAYNCDEYVGVLDEPLENPFSPGGHPNIAGTAPQVNQCPIEIQEDCSMAGRSQSIADLWPSARNRARRIGRRRGQSRFFGFHA